MGEALARPAYVRLIFSIVSLCGVHIIDPPTGVRKFLSVD